MIGGARSRDPGTERRYGAGGEEGATTDQPVKDVVGSGPYRFLPNEHISGSGAAFARFAECQPRHGHPEPTLRRGYEARCARTQRYKFCPHSAHRTQASAPRARGDKNYGRWNVDSHRFGQAAFGAN
jgi:hypothetical protein